MRGKAKRYLRFLLPTGITPAYAGKSRCSRLRCGVFRDHPRVCGEKRFHFAHGLSVPGSPPRMRGKAFESVIDGCAARITPAYAGKRNIERGCKNGFEDHPRVCGEKSKYRGICALLPGSPPRMRGKEPQRIAAAGRARITPAYAGKSEFDEQIQKAG